MVVWQPGEKPDAFAKSVPSMCAPVRSVAEKVTLRSDAPATLTHPMLQFVIVDMLSCAFSKLLA